MRHEMVVLLLNDAMCCSWLAAGIIHSCKIKEPHNSHEPLSVSSTRASRALPLHKFTRLARHLDRSQPRGLCGSARGSLVTGNG